jgi:hypothetical protein
MITVFVSGAPEGIRIPDRRYRKPNDSGLLRDTIAYYRDINTN